jgi:hypothetical protein
MVGRSFFDSLKASSSSAGKNEAPVMFGTSQPSMWTQLQAWLQQTLNKALSSAGKNEAPVCIPDASYYSSGASIFLYLVLLTGLVLAALYVRSMNELLARKQKLLEKEQCALKRGQKELQDKQGAMEQREKRLETKEQEPRELSAAKEETPKPKKQEQALARKQKLLEKEQYELKKAQKELQDKQGAVEEREKRLETKEQEARKLLVAKEETSKPKKKEQAPAAVEESPEHKAAKKKAEQEKRKIMIEYELRIIVLETEEHELGEEMESEALRALRKASMQICYLKKYYDVFKDEFIYFPSVATTFINFSMIKEAEKYYRDGDDDFPQDYSEALRSVAAMTVVDNDEEDADQDHDDDYMEKLAMDVDIGEEGEVLVSQNPSEEQVKDAERKKRKIMIEDELEKVIKQTQANELAEPFEPEALLALRKAAMEITYLKKYYDAVKDELIYFPSVTKSLVDFSLIEEAEKYYYAEEDEFPMDYSRALRSVATEFIMADDDDVDEDYMAKLAMDVAV